MVLLAPQHLFWKKQFRNQGRQNYKQVGHFYCKNAISQYTFFYYFSDFATESEIFGLCSPTFFLCQWSVQDDIVQMEGQTTTPSQYCIITNLQLCIWIWQDLKHAQLSLGYVPLTGKHTMLFYLGHTSGPCTFRSHFVWADFSHHLFQTIFLARSLGLDTLSSNPSGSGTLWSSSSVNLSLTKTPQYLKVIISFSYVLVSIPIHHLSHQGQVIIKAHRLAKQFLKTVITGKVCKFRQNG